MTELAGARDAVACANCGAELTGTFCAACGQKALHGPPTVREFLHDAADDVFNLDGKLWRTLRLLFLRPGELTLEAFNGRRARYVRPLRLYLTCSVLAFGVMALTAERPLFEAPPPPAETSEQAPAPQGDRPFGIDTDTMTDAEREQLSQQVLDGLPAFMFLMMPGFAGIVMLVMRGSGRTYIQHLYFSLHLHAVIFAIAAVLLLLNPLGRTAEGISAIGRILLPIPYGVAALRTAYGVGWWGATWRGGLILAAYLLWLFVLMLLVTLGLAVYWTLRAGSVH